MVVTWNGFLLVVAVRLPFLKNCFALPEALLSLPRSGKAGVGGGQHVMTGHRRH